MSPLNLLAVDRDRDAPTTPMKKITLVLLTLFVVATPLFAQVTEFVLDADEHPWDITLGHDGALWFLLPDGGKIGRITSSGNITRLDGQ